ncbi:MAG TPA: mannonate dehydratase [Puia sp.]|nr:mannonate dehydratase [Puia sp.]
MKNDRRSFIRKSAILAAALSGKAGLAPGLSGGHGDAHGINGGESGRLNGYVRDAGMKMSEAYFDGFNQHKIALCRQMDVLGAVGGINSGMVGLNDVKPWEYEAVLAVKNAWANEGLEMTVVEGPPALGEKTKLGLAGRDEEISNFITLMHNLKRVGVDVICYNWMPVIGWYRTDKAKVGRGGALVTAFDNEAMRGAAPTEYGIVTKEQLWGTLEYFLKAVVPEAEKAGIKLAMHPDDPPIDEIRGISRIMTSVGNFTRMLDIYPSPSNGITFCQGNFSLMGADIPSTVRALGKRNCIHFVHFRNVRGGKYKFEETFHDEGQIDMFEAMKAYYDIGFRGPIRPDHVPTMAEDSNTFAGYSTIGTLYANGYIRGLMEAVSKERAAAGDRRG